MSSLPHEISSFPLPLGSHFWGLPSLFHGRIFLQLELFIDFSCCLLQLLTLKGEHSQIIFHLSNPTFSLRRQVRICHTVMMLRFLPFLCGVGIRMIPRVSVRGKLCCQVSATCKVCWIREVWVMGHTGLSWASGSVGISCAFYYNLLLLRQSKNILLASE